MKLFGEKLEMKVLKESKPDVMGTLWNGLYWSGDVKKINSEYNYTYSHHQNRLCMDGWDRAPSPQEFMQLLYAHHGRGLPKDMEHVPEALREKTIFTNCGVNFSGDVITLYHNITNLVMNNKTQYMFDDATTYDKKVMLDISSAIRGQTCELKSLDKSAPDLFYHIFGETFDGMPDDITMYVTDYFMPMKDEKYNNKIWMIGMEFGHTPYLHLDFGTLNACSYGVNDS